jgi:hypothetical protein
MQSNAPSASGDRGEQRRIPICDTNRRDVLGAPLTTRPGHEPGVGQIVCDDEPCGARIAAAAVLHPPMDGIRSERVLMAYQGDVALKVRSDTVEISIRSPADVDHVAVDPLRRGTRRTDQRMTPDPPVRQAGCL